MLGVGWTEMLVIGVVALIVIGPKDLPAMMGRIGKFAATIRRMGSDFQRELNKTTGLNEIANLRNSVTAPLKATADAIRKEFNTTTTSGAVTPSGVMKPLDPKAESVVAEIKAAAGIAPAVAAPAAIVAAPAVAAPVVKAKRAPKVKLPADTPVAVADIPPATKAAKKPIESPAPVEAIAPAKTAKPKVAARAASTAAPLVATKSATPLKAARPSTTPAAAVPSKATAESATKPAAKAPLKAKPAIKLSASTTTAKQPAEKT